MRIALHVTTLVVAMALTLFALALHAQGHALAIVPVIVVGPWIALAVYRLWVAVHVHGGLTSEGVDWALTDLWSPLPLSTLRQEGED
jgi:hypothetical protein